MKDQISINRFSGMANGRDEAVVDQTLSNPLILKYILGYLDKVDLLTTSRVNRNWNRFSREVLREQMCLAEIGKENNCDRLKVFIEVLRNSTNSPFSGLSFEYPKECENHVCEFDEDNICEFASQILSKIHLKSLTLKISKDSSNTCVSTKFIRHLVQNCCTSLKVLHLRMIGIDQRFSVIMELGTWDGPFLPNISLLEINAKGIQQDEIDWKNFIQELIEVSPKVQVLNVQILPSFLEFILPLNLARAVKNFCFVPAISTLDLARSFAVQGPKLKTLTFRTSGGNLEDLQSEFRQEQILQILKLLVLQSGKSLLNYSADHLHLAELVRIDSPFQNVIFPSVQNLNVFYDLSIDFSREVPTFRKLDWEKYFPALREVSIYYSEFSGPVRRLIQDNVRQSMGAFICDTVEKLSLKSTIQLRDPKQISILRSIFPNIKRISFEESFYINILALLWTAWQHLEEIVVYVARPYMRNYDAIFMGIREEEVEYLLGKRLEMDLSSLQIVPIKPCVMNLTDMKKLTLILEPHCPLTCEERDAKGSSGETISLSDLAGYCAFSRLPQLQVHMERKICAANCRFALNELKPFVEFKNQRE